ncbi:hypothetical protein LIER_00283 [Lithospermum erythrorhizon]|uniref:Uncharacterized protein n=1 Tax=Lithospermum erythrorhizon TaxID=34254 RepID=A0AAV3NKF2_LITER
MSASMINREKWMGPGPPIKRKERDGTFNVSKPSPLLTTKKLAKPSPHHRHPPPKPSPHHRHSAKPSHPNPKLISNNHLLAGYLAHEFLAKGTLYGRPWDADRAASSSRIEPSLNSNGEQKGELEERYVRYKEVSDLMKMDGVNIPGIVNPTQLARFLHLR